jgi:hypothetical protein
MRTLLKAAAAILAAVAVYLLFTLPPVPAAASGLSNPDLEARTIPGAYHVHSDRSDGAGSRDEIAAAAARAGLRFIVFTDHGDGMRAPEGPRYAHGVLCLDGVEISTNGGHYVALDMRPSGYPLGGEAAAVVEDVRRLGGFGIVAHPYSPKPDLRWTDWAAPIDGLEWLSADSEWRDESFARLLRLPFDYLLRPQSALTSILDRPGPEMERWQDLMARRPVVALAAHDAHGGLGGSREGGRFPLPAFPSYLASFRAFALRAVTASPLTGSPPDDARLVLDAIRRGRVFTALDGVAGPALLDFGAAVGSTIAQMGDSLPFEDGVELSVRATLPAGGMLALMCGGEEVAKSPTGELRSRPRVATACRPEVRAPGAPGMPPVPWIAGNAIHLLSTIIEPVGSEPLFESSLVLDMLDWVVEKDPESTGVVAAERGAMRLDYTLKAGERTSQYVAAAADLRPPVPPYDRILFTAEAAAPMRVSVQLRFGGGERWVSSVFVEPDARRVIIPVEELVRAGDRSTPRPDFRQVTSILFVVDLINALPGSSGWVRISDLAFGQPVGR